jgi:hypothetical protein
MSEKIKEIFKSFFGLSDYLFYLFNSKSQELELLKIVSENELQKSISSQLISNSIGINEENSFHIAVLKYGKSIFLKNAKRGNLSHTENKNRQLLNISSIYIVPLNNSGNVFAVLSFADIDPSLQKEQNLKNLTPVDREDIELLCQSIASGLYQSLQKKELENQKKSIVELNTFIKDLNESHEIDIILNKTKLYINKYFNIEHYAVGITNEENTYARFLETSYNVPQEIKEKLRSIKIPITNTIGAHAFAYKANKPFYIKKIKSNRITAEEKYIINIFQFKFN